MEGVHAPPDEYDQLGTGVTPCPGSEVRRVGVNRYQGRARGRRGEPTAKHLRVGLRTSPYAPFAVSTTPIGLYARRFWLEENSSGLCRVERRTARRILARQRPDGSFGGLTPTIRHLYLLHLLQRERSPESDRALDWLWEMGAPSLEGARRPDGDMHRDLLLRMKRGDAARLARASGIPFSRGCAVLVKTAAGILLASVFGRGREARVLAALRCLDRVIESRGDLWCSVSCSSNILQAHAAHPDAARGRSTSRAVRTLGRIQTTSGSWPGMPFAPTFNALSQLDSRDAKTQVKRAVSLARKIQNRDGTWGKGSDREFSSFLVVDAIRRLEA